MSHRLGYQPSIYGNVSATGDAARTSPRQAHTSPRSPRHSARSNGGGLLPSFDTGIVAKVADSHRLRRFCRFTAALLVLLAGSCLAAYSAFTWWAALQTPVWGVVVRPEWVLVTGTQPVAVVTLAVPDARHAGFLEASLQEKAQYATARGYWFIACNVTLDPARPPVWSKLRLIAAVFEQVAPTVLWLDLDTIVWTRHQGIEVLQATSAGADLHAQHDFHRFRVYFNAGVMLLRSSDWSKWLLAEAYNTRRSMIFRRIGYTMEEQDALNIVAAISQRRPEGTLGRADGYKVKVHSYPRMWAFAHDALEEDGRVAQDILALHFPNCRDGTCQAAYSRHVAIAMGLPTDRPPNGTDAAKPTRRYSIDMPLRTSWFSHDR